MNICFVPLKRNNKGKPSLSNKCVQHDMAPLKGYSAFISEAGRVPYFFIVLLEIFLFFVLLV